MATITAPNGSAQASTQESQIVTSTSVDSVLRELVDARTRQVAAEHARRTEQLQQMETRGKRRHAAMLDGLDKSTRELFLKIQAQEAEQAGEARSRMAGVRERLAEAEVLALPRERRPTFTSPRVVATLFPYYGSVYTNGTVFWQGYNPGDLKLWDDASGGGSGIFGTGAGETTFYADWWFYFNTPESRWYSYTMNMPLDGYYIAHADDGFWTSKEARLSMDLRAAGYQYGYKASTQVNMLYEDGQNIDINNRYDNTYTMYYGDLLGGPDIAYLHLTLSLYVYARGDGSFAELNFNDGTANYIGVPWVVVS